MEEQTLTPLQLKDLMINVHATFDKWTELLRQLVKHCNDLLQLNIVASNTVQHKHKATTVEKQIAELLMESRVLHQKPLSDGAGLQLQNIAWSWPKRRLTVVQEGGFRHEGLLRKRGAKNFA